ncbi:hypothetical protein ES703_113663 [subsurface metagenome]
MPKKQITVSLRAVDAEHWHTVKEFALHRNMTLKSLVLVAVDQYIAKYNRKQQRKAKEV